ncbi:Pyruvate kinase [Artemisia annua]|uniref:Pyruvate kinase n=1 Tax=Artemisia annua TaxID=35608 RepID=A0A2U1MW51_ARTAN|nr:Pyruvate kinase [Artemisia annua]
MLILDPGVIVDLPTLTEKDKEDILKRGFPNKINKIAFSFGRKGSDLVEVRKLLGEHAKNIVLISKVENHEGVSNFDEIRVLANTDGFMVARGNLKSLLNNILEEIIQYIWIY